MKVHTTIAALALVAIGFAAATWSAPAVANTPDTAVCTKWATSTITGPNPEKVADHMTQEIQAGRDHFVQFKGAGPIWLICSW